jgi:hypothetical protein
VKKSLEKPLKYEDKIKASFEDTSIIPKKKVVFCRLFLWRRAPQQKLQMHRSLGAYCVAL